MKYILTIVLSIFISSGALASSDDPREDISLLGVPTINSLLTDGIVMKEDAPVVPLGYRMGNCFGKILACWNKGWDDEKEEGPGLKFQYGASLTCGWGGNVTGVVSFTSFCCGYSKCCPNGDVCCVKYGGSCCFCGNGGCLNFAQWAGVATGGWFGTALCCLGSRICCKVLPHADTVLVKMHCMNCAKGLQDGYARSKKMDDGEGSQPSTSGGGFQANAGQPA